MGDFRKASHAVYDIQYHFVWITKYRYKMLKGPVAERLRELLHQGCDARGIKIVRGNISKDHVHMLLSCPASLAPAKIVQYLKGRSSRLLQEEFPELRKRYWGQHLWASGYYCATVGAVTEETMKAYIENQSQEDIAEVFKVTE